jgi:hypothetical protein
MRLGCRQAAERAQAPRHDGRGWVDLARPHPCVRPDGNRAQHLVETLLHGIGLRIWADGVLSWHPPNPPPFGTATARSSTLRCVAALFPAYRGAFSQYTEHVGRPAGHSTLDCRRDRQEPGRSEPLHHTPGQMDRAAVLKGGRPEPTDLQELQGQLRPRRTGRDDTASGSRVPGLGVGRGIGNSVPSSPILSKRSSSPGTLDPRRPACLRKRRPERNQASLSSRTYTHVEFGNKPISRARECSPYRELFSAYA